MTQKESNRNYWHSDPAVEGRLAFTLFAQAKGLMIGWDDLSQPCKDYWAMACSQTLSPKPLAAVLETTPFTMGDL